MDGYTLFNDRYYNPVILLALMILSIVVCDTENLPEFLAEESELYCPDEKTPSLPYIHVPWNTEFRAYKTAPSYIRISPSSIPNGGLGAFTDTFIKKYTVLAEFEGEVVIKLFQISDYAWKLKRSGKKIFYIDAYDVAASNWLRWINCSRNRREENVDMWQCRSKAYYVASRDIHPGEELLVYYGDGYAKSLNIDVDNYENTEDTEADHHLCTQNCSNTGE